jgi:superfamily II DNA/RNA helicase
MLTFIAELPRLNEENQMHGPYALILAPTRELALQIEQETLKFAKPMGYHCVAIVGGVSRQNNYITFIRSPLFSMPWKNKHLIYVMVQKL